MPMEFCYPANDIICYAKHPPTSILHVGSMIYYSTATTETMFHVSTMLPHDGHVTLQHIGNDEVHIIWHEHHRPYDMNCITRQVQRGYCGGSGLALLWLSLVWICHPRIIFNLHSELPDAEMFVQSPFFTLSSRLSTLSSTQ